MFVQWNDAYCVFILCIYFVYVYYSLSLLTNCPDTSGDTSAGNCEFNIVYQFSSLKKNRTDGRVAWGSLADLGKITQPSLSLSCEHVDLNLNRQHQESTPLTDTWVCVRDRRKALEFTITTRKMFKTGDIISIYR